MKNKITKITALTAITLAACTAMAGAQETVKVGVAAEPYPPFTVPDASGNWTGWEIDIMNAVCEAAEIECEVTPIAWDGIIPALTSGRIDMIMSSMSITAEREETIDFSDKYYNTPTAIVASKGAEIEPTTEGLSGKILGVQVSTVHEDYARAHFPDAEIKTYQTQDEANQDLYAGRIDAIQADGLALDAFLTSEAGQSCCELMGEVEPDEEILGPGVGAGLRKDDDELEEKINAAIAEIRENGTYDEISNEYFDFDIYGS